MRKLLYFIFLLTSSFSILQGANAARMVQDLDIIKSTFETKYAPYEWKKSYFGWSLEEEINIAKMKVISLNSLTVKDYQRILHAFFISTHDYHVHDYYHSTEISLLPFEVSSINNVYYITDVNTRALMRMQDQGYYKGEKPLERGNELILFDAQPIESVTEDLKFQELGNPSSRTSQRLAERILTKRIGALGHSIPQGTILISFKATDGSIVDAEIDWIHFEEKIKNHAYTIAMKTFGKYSAQHPIEKRNLSPSKPCWANKKSEMVNHLAEALQKDYNSLIDQRVGLPRIQTALGYEDESELEDPDEEPTEILPTTPRVIKRDNILFGEKIWEELEHTPYHALIYKHPDSDKKIGYIRIQSYIPPENKSEANLFALRLAHSLRHLELHSDALVIDQVDNPGGELYLSLGIASMLTNQPLKLPKNQVAITQNEISLALSNLTDLFSALEELEELEEEFGSTPPFQDDQFHVGFYLEKSFIKNQIDYYQFLIEEWNEGKTLTSAYPIEGIEYLQPHPLSQYSKPILLLINSNDFSCGDLVPSILQDNHRAVLFGEQTAGAGGAVQKHSYPNSFGLEKFSYTVSLLKRPNGMVIENLGITPDVPYELTENDLLNGYKDYIKAVNQTLGQMLQGK
jgi:hypothetical protein